MPLSNNDPQSINRHLTRLLAAMADDNGGELRIPLKSVRKIEQESARQMLCEDTDVEKDELVLRFGTKHSVVYVVEPECPTPRQNAQASPATSQPTSTPSSRKPMTVEQLAKLEKNLRARRVEAQLKQDKERQQRELSEILGSNSTA